MKALPLQIYTAMKTQTSHAWLRQCLGLKKKECSKNMLNDFN